MKKSLAICLLFGGAVVVSAQPFSIQEAINANPGKVIYLPAGDYEIAEKIQIRTDNTGLYGPGQIIQTNTNAPIIEIERASGVRLEGLTLMRPDGKAETGTEAVLAMQCRELVLENLRVLSNRTRSGAISLHQCPRSQIRNCLVKDYMRISIDDRTAGTDWGYAFNYIDGTGISVRESEGVLIQGNRVIEETLLPTPEIKEKFGLGKFVKKNAQKGSFISQKTWDAEYVSNWHQGSAIIATSPMSTDCVQILGNYIENAAQGIDIHADHVIVAQNIVNNAFMGMKAMHGSRNTLIIGNQFVKNDLWSIGLMPGAASCAVTNVDGGSVIANNIISDFGYGHAHWIWGDGGCPIKLDAGQEPDDPPLTDVVVQGNVVYDTGLAQNEPPRYRYAVSVATKVKRLRFSNNILHPGLKGVSNIELEP
jgi:hypothetical protein